MPVARHAWESEQDHAWEIGSDDDAEPDPETDPGAASMMFVDLLLSLYMASQISAQHFGVLCYWATRAGIQHVSEYSIGPGKPSGHYQRHLDRTLGFEHAKKHSYNLRMPGQLRGEASRTKICVPSKPPHEAAQEYLEQNPEAWVKLTEAIDQNELPPTYFNNPIVQSSDEAVMPWGLYMDSVPYSLVDSVLGCWLINIITGARIMLCLIRKRLVCQCGCRGWCTYYGLLSWLHWSFESMSSGLWPSTRHDGQPWDDHDTDRRNHANKPFKQRGMLLRIKGDWEEFCMRLGFPSWQSGTRPCFCCAASGPDLYDVSSVSVLSLPFYLNQDSDYDRGCQRCEIWVLVDENARKNILGRLQYDKRPQGSHGRSLVADIPELHLLAKDRLEPCKALPDVADFEELVLPCRILFWRLSQETLCCHRCPLFDSRLGISPSITIAIDLLHTLFLGPMMVWCRLVLWMLLQSGIWGAHETTDGERIQIGLMMFKAELFRFYERWSKDHRDEPLTRISNITLKMIGTKDDQKLKLKAMETYGMLMCLLDLLQKYRLNVGDKVVRLIASGRCLVDYVALLKRSAMNMPASSLQDSKDISM